MSIEKRTTTKGVRYDVVVYQEHRAANGRRRKFSRTAKTLNEARRWEATLKTEADGGAVRDGRRTVGDLLGAWMADNADTWSRRTTYDYARLIEREIRRPLGAVKLDRLGPRELEAVYRDMRKRGLADRSVRNVHRLLSAAMASGVRWGWMAANVTQRTAVGHTGGPVGRVASQAEVTALLAGSDAQTGVLIRLAATTGARRSELCALDWSDIDFTTGTVSISKAVVEAGGVHVKDCKNHQARIVPLDATTVDLLRRHRGIGPVLGLSPSGASRRFRALCEELGITGLGLHGLRHFVGTALIAGHDLRTVAGRLGHRDATTTLNVYSHQLDARDRAAADAMGALLG